MTDTKQQESLDTRWLRNVANSGRGSAMTDALHKAADDIDALKTGLEIIDSHFKAEQRENDELRAKLRALEEQKPVAMWNFSKGFDNCRMDELNDAAKKNPAPLYLAAGAKP